MDDLLRRKNRSSERIFFKLCRKLQISKNFLVVTIRIDHGRKFNQDKFIDYCDKSGISHNFSALRTSQQNEVVERENRH